VEEVEIRDLKLFAVARDQRARAGDGRIVEANRVGPVAARGRLAGGDGKRRALERSEDSDPTWIMASRKPPQYSRPAPVAGGDAMNALL
jgi:hypothetical protein